MMSEGWKYRQNTGEILFNDSIQGVGYSGYGSCMNDSDYDMLKDEGPIPQGLWQIGRPYDSEEHGPYVLPLQPMPGTDTFGRSGFLIHGDRLAGPPKSASHGCIILGRALREQIAESGDRVLEVVPL